MSVHNLNKMADGIVCPSKLSKSLFTTGSVDNIHHNPSLPAAKHSFYGTAISLTKHPTNDFEGIDRNRVLINADLPKRKTVSKLPKASTSIQPYMEQESKKDYYVPGGCNANKPKSDLVTENMKCEYQWLNKAEELLEKEKLEEKEYLSWSAHFASLETAALSPTAIMSLLPQKMASHPLHKTIFFQNIFSAMVEFAVLTKASLGRVPAKK